MYNFYNIFYFSTIFFLHFILLCGLLYIGQKNKEAYMLKGFCLQKERNIADRKAIKYCFYKNNNLPCKFLKFLKFKFKFSNGGRKEISYY